MTFKDYSRHDAVGLAALIRDREVSALEVLDAAIARTEAVNGTINAIVHKAYDEARAAAAAALPGGLLSGVPFLAKDLHLHVKGWPLSNGSRWFDGYVSPRDSELTRRWRDGGLVLFGKTNTPEFGITGTTESRRLGPARNPWNPAHIAGGSSGGAAAAVAAGILPMAHATDGLGSIRIPAACCGLVGLKVTRHRAPLDERAPGTGFAVGHVVSHTVRDTAAMLDVVAWHEPHAPYPQPPRPPSYLDDMERAPGRLRIAFTWKAPVGLPYHPEVEATMRATLATLESLGHHVFERDLEMDWPMLYRGQGAWGASDFAAGMQFAIADTGRMPGPDDIEPLSRWIWEQGQKITGEQAMQGARVVRDGAWALLAQWAHFDVLLTPTMITLPPVIGHIDPVALDPQELNTRQAVTFGGFTPPMNFTGQPSLSLPLGQSAGGLPIGMMFSGRYGDEATLLRLARQLEEAMPWRDRKAPLFA